MKLKNVISVIGKWLSLKRYRKAITVYSDQALLRQFVTSILSDNIDIQKLKTFYQPIFRTYWNQGKYLRSLEGTKQLEHYEQHKWQIHILAWKDAGSTSEFNEWIAIKLFHFKCNHLLIENKYPAILEWSNTSNSICMAMYNIVSVTMGITEGKLKASTPVVEVIDFWFKEVMLTKSGDMISHYLMTNILIKIKDNLSEPNNKINVDALQFFNNCLERWILLSPLTALILETTGGNTLSETRILALFEDQCNELHPWLIRQFVNEFSINTPPDMVSVFGLINKNLRAKAHTLWGTVQWNMAFFMIDLYHFFTLSLSTMEEVLALTENKHKTNKKLMNQYEAFFKPLKYIQETERSLRMTYRGTANSPKRVFRKKYQKMEQKLPVTEDWRNQRIENIESKLRAFRNHILSIRPIKINNGK